MREASASGRRCSAGPGTLIINFRVLTLFLVQSVQERRAASSCLPAACAERARERESDKRIPLTVHIRAELSKACEAGQSALAEEPDEEDEGGEL